MKKIFFSFLLVFPFFCNAQANHEVKLNILNTIVRASVEVGYEYFTSESSSADLEILSIGYRF